MTSYELILSLSLSLLSTLRIYFSILVCYQTPAWGLVSFLLLQNK